VSEKITYSIVIPVYNNQEGIEILVDSVVNYFQDQSSEIILVDDFSMDLTWTRLKELKQTHPEIKIIRLSKNVGQHAATLCGIHESCGESILTMDDDLNILPDEFSKLIETKKQSSAKVIYGEFHTKQPLIRMFLTKSYKKLSKIEGKNKGRGSSFRLIEGQLARTISQQHSNFVFIDEFLLWYTNEVEFVPVEKNENQRSVSRYSTLDLFQKTSHLIMYSSDFPLKLVTYLGFIMSSTNLLIGLFFMYRKFIDKITEVGYASLIVSVLFSTGLIIFSLGILSQYVRKILRNQNNEPLYYISEKEC
jgi:glycosyltransferase involved in cell wall biosynthesis